MDTPERCIRKMEDNTDKMTPGCGWPADRLVLKIETVARKIDTVMQKD
jgi:hypothetical protein